MELISTDMYLTAILLQRVIRLNLILFKDRNVTVNISVRNWKSAVSPFRRTVQCFSLMVTTSFVKMKPLCLGLSGGQVTQGLLLGGPI